MGLTVVAVLCDVAVADHHVVLQLVGPRCFQIETADLFAFQIVRESGIGAGTRRIEAVVGEAA